MYLNQWTAHKNIIAKIIVDSKQYPSTYKKNRLKISELQKIIVYYILLTVEKLSKTFVMNAIPCY